MNNPNAGADTGPIMDAAFKRSLIGAAIAGLGTLFATLPQTDDWKIILSAAGGAAVGVVASRFGVEGMYDSKRAERGDVNAGDVPVASNSVNVVKVG